MSKQSMTVTPIENIREQLAAEAAINRAYQISLEARSQTFCGQYTCLAMLFDLTPYTPTGELVKDESRCF